MRELAQEVDKDWPSVLAKLEAIRQILVNRRSMLCNVTLDSANWASFQPQLEGFLAQPAGCMLAAGSLAAHTRSAFEGLAIPAQVNYVGKGANLYELGYSSHGSVDVITNYLRTTWLWERVRVQGGAYGGFCLFNRRSGVFTYLSYRDPNLLDTLDNYDAAARFLQRSRPGPGGADQKHHRRHRRYGRLPAPGCQRLYLADPLLAGDTDQDRQRWREQILGATQADFHAFGETLAGWLRQAWWLSWAARRRSSGPTPSAAMAGWK